MTPVQNNYPSEIKKYLREIEFKNINYINSKWCVYFTVKFRSGTSAWSVNMNEEQVIDIEKNDLAKKNIPDILEISLEKLKQKIFNCAREAGCNEDLNKLIDTFDIYVPLPIRS